ncbi:unnamed protein product [Calypogeia fissa]
MLRLAETKGQQIRVKSQLQNECYDRRVIFDKTQCLMEDFEYEGAIVSDPLPGVYKWCSLLDFSSLYPSMIISHNIAPFVKIMVESSAPISPPRSDLPYVNFGLSHLAQQSLSFCKGSAGFSTISFDMYNGEEKDGKWDGDFTATERARGMREKPHIDALHVKVVATFGKNAAAFAIHELFETHCAHHLLR